MVLDLHGNVLRGDISPDGSIDQNVFDIKQTGAAISILVRTNVLPNKSVANFDLWGDRNSKYLFLNQHSINSISKKILYPKEPEWLLIDQNDENLIEYNSGFCLSEAMPLHSLALVSGRDKFVIDQDKQSLKKRIKSFKESNETGENLDKKFGLRSSSWFSSTDAKNKLPITSKHEESIKVLTYRPFDNRYCFYHRSIFRSLRRPVMKNLEYGKNLILLSTRMVKGEP